MQFTNETKSFIVQLKQEGYSSRYIADKLGCSKSGVNQFYNKWKDDPRPLYDPAGVALSKALDKSIDKFGKENLAKALSGNFKQSTKPRILLLDIETTADIVATFGRFKQNIGEKNIIQQGNEIATAAWKFLGDNECKFAVSSFDNFKIGPVSEVSLLQQLVASIEEADAVVIHNAKFDLGTITHRMLHYKMGALPNVKVIDTLLIARKHLKLRSNKLDSITKYFGLSNKMENSGIDLWIRVQQGDNEALKEMLDYNIADVEALEDVYNTFVPLNQGISVAPFMPLEHKHCTNCGSTNVHPTGRKVTTYLSAFDEYHCSDCGATMRNRTNTLTKEQRKNLLMPV